MYKHISAKTTQIFGYIIYYNLYIDEENNKLTNIDWNPSGSLPAFSNLQCIQSGCYVTAEFNVLSPEKCRVPLLSLQFWLTGKFIILSYHFISFPVYPKQYKYNVFFR